jgi:hypothetical protein
MPTNQQLCRAICPDSRRFPLTDNRVSRKIESIFISERVCPLDIVAFHRDFAEVVEQGRSSKRTPIVAREMKHLGNLIRNGGDSKRVRIFVPLKSVNRYGELKESFVGAFVD